MGVAEAARWVSMYTRARSGAFMLGGAGRMWVATASIDSLLGPAILGGNATGPGFD